jgi:hypothetical protein
VVSIFIVLYSYPSKYLFLAGLDWSADGAVTTDWSAEPTGGAGGWAAEAPVAATPSGWD